MDRLGPYLLGPNDVNQGIYTGDARELAKAIPDESVDLIFTDPVYQNMDDYLWVSMFASRVLKNGGSLLAYCAQYHLASTIAQLGKHLIYRWLLVEKKISSGALIWSYRLYSHYISLLWFTKGVPIGECSRIDFLWSMPKGSEVNFKWSKNRQRIAYWIERFTEIESVIVDPFCGGGAIPSGCKSVANRGFLAFEKDPSRAESACQRIALTQPPLPGLRVQQLAIGLDV